MGCGCKERRGLTMQAIQNMKRGDMAAAKQNALRFAQTLRTDAARATSAVRSTLNTRPISRR